MPRDSAGSPEASPPSRFEIEDYLVLVRGAGDVATGVGRRLFLAGFPVLMTEIQQPVCIRRTVAFAEAIYEKAVQVEGVEARAANWDELAQWSFRSTIPVIVDKEGQSIGEFKPQVLVDARMMKRNLDTRIDQAPIVGAMGPGFTAGLDCHFVVETKRRHHLGRVIYRGNAQANTGRPAAVEDYTSERVIYAPQSGRLKALVAIGESVSQGTAVAEIEGRPLCTRVSGMVRGMLRSGLLVEKGTKISDIDPRAKASFCYTISDRSNAIAGGVLEGILASLSHRE